MAQGMRPANPAAAAGRLLAAAALLALLAGCGAFAPPPPPRPAVVQRPPARPAPRPVPPRPPVPLAAEQPPAAATPAAPPPAAETVPLPNLARMPAGQVEQALGAPSARAASGAGERWSYRGPGCTLDLFLFPDMGSGGLVVLDRRAGGASEQECLRRMRDGT
jgi:hypothetical protein